MNKIEDNVSILNNYSDRILKIYNTYLDVISPFIFNLEILEFQFPVAILNEIRAIFTHLSKLHIYISKYKTQSEIDEEIRKAERHTRRAILDCYKYLCIAYNDFYENYNNIYKKYDLSSIDNGEFIINLSKLRQNAMSELENAKLSEITKEDDDNTYLLFEKAYLASHAVYDKIKISINKLERVKRKSNIALFFSISGWIIGAVGLTLTIISLL